MAQTLTKEQLDQLVAQYANPDKQDLIRATLQLESAYGANPNAYKPNKDGAIGVGQILSKQLGGKYDNFGAYAAKDMTDPMNPVHSAVAAINMMNKEIDKAGGNVDKFAKAYLGSGTDRNGTNSTKYASILRQNMATGYGGKLPTTSKGLADYATALSAPIPQFTSAPPLATQYMDNSTNTKKDRAGNIQTNTKYATQLEQAAANIAAANAASNSMYGVNTVGNSEADINRRNIWEQANAIRAEAQQRDLDNMSKLNKDGSKKSSLGWLYDNTVGALLNTTAMGNSAGTIRNLTARDAALAKAATDQQAVNAGQFTNPEILKALAANSINQQQVNTANQNADTTRFNAVDQGQQWRQGAQVAQAQATTQAYNARTQEMQTQLAAEAQLREAEMRQAGTWGVEKGKQVTSFNPATMPSTAADLAAATQGIADNPYDAVKVAQSPNAPIAMAEAAIPHVKFQEELAKMDGAPTRAKGTIDKPLSKEEIAADNASYNQKLRVFINSAYRKAAEGTDSAINALPSNPYRGVAPPEKVGNITLPQGLGKDDLYLPSTKLMSKLMDLNISPVAGAKLFSDLATASKKDLNYSVFAAPTPIGNFPVILKGSNGKAVINLASPEGFARYRAYLKATDIADTGLHQPSLVSRLRRSTEAGEGTLLQRTAYLMISNGGTTDINKLATPDTFSQRYVPPRDLTK